MNFIYAKVEVTVQNGEITDIIILEHRHEHGKAAETVINEIVDCSILNVTVNQALFYVVERGNFHDLYRRISRTHRVHVPCLL